MLNISLFSTIIPIETNFACTQWTYDSFIDTTVYKISSAVLCYPWTVTSSEYHRWIILPSSYHLCVQIDSNHEETTSAHPDRHVLLITNTTSHQEVHPSHVRSWSQVPMFHPRNRLWNRSGGSKSSFLTLAVWLVFFSSGMGYL